MQKHSGRALQLHRIASGQDAEKDKAHGWVGVYDAMAVCGLTGDFMMPGIFSRMGAPRCRKCCKLLNIPVGNGAPFNMGIKEGRP